MLGELKGGRCGEEHERQFIPTVLSLISRWVLGLAYLDMQTLWSVREDGCVSGKAQDSSSCFCLGVVTTLTMAIRTGRAPALCVGACSRLSIKKCDRI